MNDINSESHILKVGAHYPEGLAGTAGRLARLAPPGVKIHPAVPAVHLNRAGDPCIISIYLYGCDINKYVISSLHINNISLWLDLQEGRSWLQKGGKKFILAAAALCLASSFPG